MIDLDSSDLFLDYCHGPDEPQELEQLIQPLSNSAFENSELILNNTEREPNSTSFILIFLVILDMLFCPWKWGVIVHFIP